MRRLHRPPSGARGPFSGLALLGTLALGLLSTPCHGASGEYQLKAAFIYNFLKFIKLPRNQRDSAHIHVCVVMEEPFLGELSSLEGRKVGELQTKALALTEISPSSPCEVVFFHDTYKGDIPSLLESLTKREVLTIGEQPDFLEKGGMIAFVLEENKVRFDVNLRRAREGGITMSAQLLKVARNVEDG